MLTLKRLSLYIFLGLLAYMPLHIFLSTWIGSSLNILPGAKAAKDVVLVIGFLTALVAAHRQSILKSKLTWAIVAYALLTLVLAVLKPTDQDAEILGVVYNTRFLLFFLYAGLLTQLYEPAKLRRLALAAVIGVGTVVLFFGIIQYSVLPNDALQRVGYSRNNGVLPAFFIDDKPDLERAMSTLRDPNSFGAYTIILLSLALTAILYKRGPPQVSCGVLALGLLSLIMTFSRSAWISALITFGLLIVWRFGRDLFNGKRLQLTLLITLLTIMAAGFLYGARNTYLVQNVILHADESTVLETPNELRIRFLRESVEDIANEPLGHGPGTAGIVSIRNNVQGTELNENYYLQVAYEVGVIGLALFFAIVIWVAVLLIRQASNSALSTSLFVSLVGLSFGSLFIHLWSNEAVAYTWWGLAGLATVWHKPVNKAKASLSASAKRGKITGK